MSETLILYTRDQCGLCETAEALALAAGVAVRPVDISADMGLLLRYCHTIPVVRDPASGAELKWPFDSAALRQFDALRAVPDSPDTAT